jgi:hypothetical protein
MKQIIGFANQYYTLWSMEEQPQYVQDAYGNYWLSRTDVKYYYHQNIAKSIDDVKRKYPQLQIDEYLRGKSRDWVKGGNDETPNHIFWRGKYAGKLISEVAESDWQYVLWAYNNIRKNRDYIETLPQYVAYQNQLTEQRMARENEKNNLLNQIPIGKPIVVNGISNGFNLNRCQQTYKILSVSFEATIEGMDTKIWVICSDARQVSGLYPYLMPVINGKAQKTKNKSFTIIPTDVKVYNDYSISIWIDPITPTYGSNVIY